MSLFTPNWLYWEHRVKISANECQWKELVVAHGEHTYYIYIQTCWCAHAYTLATPRARASRAGGQLCGIMLYLYPTPLPQVYIYLLPNQPQFAIVCVCAIIFTSSCSHLDYEFLCCVEQRLDPPRTSKYLCFCWSAAWHQRHLGVTATDGGIFTALVCLSIPQFTRRFWEYVIVTVVVLSLTVIVMSARGWVASTFIQWMITVSKD